MAYSRRDIESRDNEIKSTRESEQRVHEMIEEYNMDHRSQLDVPKGVRKEGYDYYWAATNIRGQDVYDVERLAAKKWTIVTADRAPNYAHDPLKRNPYSGKYIATKDLVLMERPEKYSKMERDAFHRMADDRVKSLRGVRDSFDYMTSPGTFTTNRISSF